MRITDNSQPVGADNGQPVGVPAPLIASIKLAIPSLVDGLGRAGARLRQTLYRRNSLTLQWTATFPFSFSTICRNLSTISAEGEDPSKK